MPKYVKCKICKKGRMVYIGVLRDYLCDNCTKCPKCGRRPATLNDGYGVLPCKICGKISSENDGPRRNPWTEEKLATPFWRLMGHKAKPREAAMEREMHYRGFTYATLRRARAAEAKKRGKHFNPNQLKQELYAGRLKSKDIPVNYGK